MTQSESSDESRSRTREKENQTKIVTRNGLGRKHFPAPKNGLKSQTEVLKEKESFRRLYGLNGYSQSMRAALAGTRASSFFNRRHDFDGIKPCSSN